MEKVRTDWFQILLDLQRAGLHNARVAQILGVSAVTVHQWKNGAEPRHSHGQALLALHVKHTEISQS